MTIAENLDEVRARIARAAAASGRDTAGIKLIAVSKTKRPEAIREAYAHGQRAFGENYAQELEAKALALADLPDIEWHFIGHLQSNKAKVVARAAHVVHAVDGEGLARELGKRVANGGRTLPVLVEVNVGGEPQKHGATAADLEDVLRAVETQPALVLRGLMTIPPEGVGAAQRAFDTLRSVRALHGGARRLPELSMGMSADLEVAIAAGATLLRVGTAIFGERSP
jgi:pyridoxal phosphate enzyme (YggS family)